MSDISTQSDVVVDSSPQVEEVTENLIVDEVETEGETKEQPKVEADKQEDEHDDDSSLPKGAIKRIDKLTRQKYEQQAVINKLQSRLDAIEAQTAPTLQEPDMSDFGDLDSYIKATVKYEKELERKQTHTELQQQYEGERLQQDWRGKVEKVRSVAPDFDEAFSNVESIAFADIVTESVAKHPKGAEIAYMLGKNVSEAYRIAALDPISQLMEIGALAAKVSLPKPKTVSSAPAPVKPVQGGASNSSPPADIDEWMKWRNDQLRQKKR